MAYDSLQWWLHNLNECSYYVICIHNIILILWILLLLLLTKLHLGVWYNSLIFCTYFLFFFNYLPFEWVINDSKVRFRVHYTNQYVLGNIVDLLSIHDTSSAMNNNVFYCQMNFYRRLGIFLCRRVSLYYDSWDYDLAVSWSKNRFLLRLKIWTKTCFFLFQILFCFKLRSIASEKGCYCYCYTNEYNSICYCYTNEYNSIEDWWIGYFFAVTMSMCKGTQS